MRMILVGPPGAGKGVLSGKLSGHFQIPVLSTGDTFREAIKQATELGREVKSYLEAGELVPDEIVLNIVKERLSQEDAAHGFLLDGFPRTVHQAKALDAFLQAEDKAVDYVIQMKISDKVILGRLTSRRVCPDCLAIYNLISMPPKQAGICDRCGSDLIQRKDDTAQVIMERIEVYREQTQPVVEYYKTKEKVVTVDSSGEAEDTFQDALVKVQ